MHNSNTDLLTMQTICRPGASFMTGSESFRTLDTINSIVGLTVGSFETVEACIPNVKIELSKLAS